MLCEVDLADREQASADLDSAPIVNGQQDLGRLTVLHHVGNSMSRRHLSRLPVEAMDSILVLADEELTASEALQSDSRCLASLLLCWDVSSQARTDGLARTWAASGAQARPAAGAKGASGRRVSSDFADMSVSRRFSPKASQAEQQILCEILDFRTRDILHQARARRARAATPRAAGMRACERALGLVLVAAAVARPGRCRAQAHARHPRLFHAGLP